MGKAKLIINPASGDGKNEKRLKTTEQKLLQYYDDVTIAKTKQAGDARHFAEQLNNQQFEAVFVSGGDGTLNEVISGLMSLQERPIVGIIPTGTFNAVAKNLAIPENLTKQFKHFDKNKLLSADIGRVNQRYFSYVLSIGELPEVVHNVDSAEKSSLGSIAYFKNFFSKFFSNQASHQLRLSMDDQTIACEAELLLVMLVRKVGRIHLIDKDAQFDDGVLHVFVIRHVKIKNLMSILFDMINGRVKSNDNISYYRTTTLKITSSTATNCDIDGEKGPDLPLELEIMPKALRFYHQLEKRSQ